MLLAGCCSWPFQDKVEYEIDMQAVMADFEDDGTFELRVPGGSVMIAGEATCISTDCSRQNQWGEMHPNGTVVIHYDNFTKIIEGELVDEPGSSASLILGEYGVTGTADLASGRRYEFNPREVTRGDFIQQVTFC